MIHNMVRGDASGSDVQDQGIAPVGNASMSFSPLEEAHMIAAAENLGGDAVLTSPTLPSEWNYESVFEGILPGAENLKSDVHVEESQQHLEHLITPESQDILSGVVQGAPRNLRKAAKASSGSQDATHEKAAKRQQRYRQRKKEEEMHLEERLMAQRTNLNVSRVKYDELKRKHAVLKNLLGFTLDVQEIIVGKEHGGNFKEDVDRLIELTCSKDVIELEELTSHRFSSPVMHIGRLYADVLSSYHNTVDNKTESLTCSWNSFVSSMVGTAPLESMYPLFLSQVGKLLDQYDQSQGNVDEEKSKEKELICLFGLRDKAFVSMVQDRPEIVLNHLFGGFDGDYLKENPLWDESSSLAQRSDLVENLHLSDEQVAQIIHRWRIFLDSWEKLMNRIRDQVLSLLDDISDSEHSGHVTYCSLGLNRAMHMHKVFWPQDGEQNLNQASYRQFNLIIKLHTDIAAILSPIQMARVCMACPMSPCLLSLPGLLLLK